MFVGPNGNNNEINKTNRQLIPRRQVGVEARRAKE